MPSLISLGSPKTHDNYLKRVDQAFTTLVLVLQFHSNAIHKKRFERQKSGMVHHFLLSQTKAADFLSYTIDHFNRAKIFFVMHAFKTTVRRIFNLVKATSEISIHTFLNRPTIISILGVSFVKKSCSKKEILDDTLMIGIQHVLLTLL